MRWFKGGLYQFWIWSNQLPLIHEVLSLACPSRPLKSNPAPSKAKRHLSNFIFNPLKMSGAPGGASDEEEAHGKPFHNELVSEAASKHRRASKIPRKALKIYSGRNLNQTRPPCLAAFLYVSSDFIKRSGGNIPFQLFNLNRAAL